MIIFLMILSICSLSYFVQNLSGPFNIFGLIRNKLLKNKYIGTFVYELLSCPWCVGFHSGYLIYLLLCVEFDFRFFIIFGLAGSTINALFSSIFEKLTSS